MARLNKENFVVPFLMKKRCTGLKGISASVLLAIVMHGLCASGNTNAKEDYRASLVQPFTYDEKSTIKGIVSSAPKPGFKWRHVTLHQLSPSFFENEAQQWLTFLKKGECPEGWQIDNFLSLKNDVFDFLIKHKVRLNDLTQLALNVIEDTSQYIVWRDYCVQKLSILLASGQLSPQNEQAIFSKLSLLSSGEIPGLTGTALIGSFQLLKDSLTARHVRESELAELAFQCASSEEAQSIDRITAFQVAAELGHPQLADYAQSVLSANDPNTSVMFKVSAIAALGVLGDASNVPYLISYQNSSDVRIQKAARKSIDRIYSN